jgi:hypothetical protein
MRSSSSSTKAFSLAVSFEDVLSLAKPLRPVEQAKLVARPAPQIERLLAQWNAAQASPTRQSLRELLADLGTAPSAEEIDEVQREM